MADSDTFGRTASYDFGLHRLGHIVITLSEREQISEVNADTDTSLMTIHLAYAETVERQHYRSLQVQAGTTLYQALAQAGWLSQFESLATWCEQVVDIDVPKAKLWHVGIYAQKQPLSYLLQPSDRIEVYRSLTADPMSQRKNKSLATRS